MYSIDARDVVAFADLRGGGHRLLEIALVALVMFGQADGDIGREAAAHGGAVYHGAIARDDAFALKLLHAAQAGGWREADLRRKIGVGDAAILLQFAQYPAVYIVHLRHGLQK